MPKVIRSRNLVSVGEVEIPDQVTLEVDTTPADAGGVNESPEAPSVPQPNYEQEQRRAEEQFRSQLKQMQLQAEEAAKKILMQAGEEREQLLQKAQSDADLIRTQAREEAYQAAVQEKRQKIDGLLASMETLLQQMQKQQQQYFSQYEKALPDLALEIAAKIMEDAIQADPLVMKPLVQRAVAQVKEAEWLEIQVSQQLPELVRQLQEELPEWTDIRHTDVLGNLGEPGACVVHTPQGVIDASVSTQLQNLKKQLQAAVRN